MKNNFDLQGKYGKLLIVLGVVLVFVFGGYFFNERLAGHAVLNLNANYQEGQNLDGILRLSLREGELIPASTKVVFENANQRKEFALGEIVTGKAITGNYYIEGKNVSGEGLGFGVPGSSDSYPDISFEFKVISEASSGGGGGDSEGVQNVSGDEEGNVSGEEMAPIEETTPAEETTPTEEETPTEETPVPTEEATSAEEETTSAEETSSAEETTTTEESASTEEASSDTSTDSDTSSSDSGEESTSPLTGNVVLGVETTAITGRISSGKSFSYNLEPGQSVELVPDSVKMKSYSLDDSVLNIKVVDGVATFSSDYSFIEEGFGVNYLGDATKDVEINLSSIDLVFSAGDLYITFVYGNEEIISLSTVLQEGRVEKTEELVPKVLEAPVAPVQNLTEEEKAVIIKKFGKVSLTTTKSEVSGGKLVRNYKIGDYEMVASYDYGSSDLEEQMREDGINFLRDLSIMISEKGVSPTSDGRFLGSSDF